MSGHVSQCGGCHRHYNTKHNRFCPRCGGRPVFKSEEPVTPEAVQKLKEHFGHG